MPGLPASGFPYNAKLTKGWESFYALHLRWVRLNYAGFVFILPLFVMWSTRWTSDRFWNVTVGVLFIYYATVVAMISYKVHSLVCPRCGEHFFRGIQFQ